MPSIFEYISYGEFIRLIVCVTIDGVEYVIPIFLTPFVGTIYSFVGLVTSLYMFGWIGLISALDLISGLDILPMLTITWVVWVLSKRWGNIEDALRYGRF